MQGFRGDQGLEMRCLVEGEPEPKVEWYFKEKKLSDSQIYTLPNNKSLLISFMVPELAGRYVCLVKNPVGIINATILLEYASMSYNAIYS